MTLDAPARPARSGSPGPRRCLFTLWIPILFMIPFHGDLEAVALLGVIFLGGGALGWLDRKWRDEEKLQIWAGGFERGFLLLALWLLAQRLWGDEWEPFRSCSPRSRSRSWSATPRAWW